MRRLAATVALFGLAACSSGTSATAEDVEAIASPTPDLANDQSTTESEQAQAALDDVLSEIMTERLTAFRFEMYLGNDRVQLTEGVADAHLASWTATTHSTEPGSPQTYTWHARSWDGSVWMQMESWPDAAAGCWLPMGPTQAPLGVQALVPHEPTYVSSLGALHADGFTDPSGETLSGSLELRAAGTLLHAQLFEEIEISQTQAATGSVPVEISHANGRMTRVTIDGHAMATAIDTAGGTLTELVTTFLENTHYVIEYLPEPSSPPAASAPPEDLVMAGDGTGCHE